MTKPADFLIRPLLNATGRGKLTILIYHRVLPSVDELFPGTADARRFAEQLSWLKGAVNVIPLPEAIEKLREGRLPDRAACITFDDGYADNATVALPLLLRHRLNATFFISTGFLDGGRMFNDTIIESVRRAPGGMIDLGFLEMGAHRIDTPRSRRAVIEQIIDKLKYLPASLRQLQVDALARSVGADLPRDLMMRSDQVLDLHRNGMAIGAHTVTHPILARLDPSEARSEIQAGRDRLESVVGAPVKLFAYPNGKPGQDYGPAHVAMVRDLGFAAALSTRRAAADARSDLYQLPRFTPWGDSALRFGIGLARNNLGSYAR
jgi:peptidoglycan/xylan/chitin deacetylase (PgdA/CDA1 family)